jgi:hypothetical protein
MKRIVLTLLMIVALAASAYADTIQLNETFVKTNSWLKKEHLSITGGQSGVRDDASAFAQGALLFYGEATGNPAHRTPAQRENMAKRAAVVTAQRAVAEYLGGFAIAGGKLVRDSTVESELIRSSVSAFVKGAQVVFQEYDKDSDSAIAVIKISLRGPTGFASTIYEHMGKDPVLKKVVATDNPVFKLAPAVLDQIYDGLIIDATEQNFRPALINRIVTSKGEVIYDPAKISQKVLVEQGCGEYTNRIDKARAALEGRGVKNPLVLKASGAVSSTDLQINDEDALTVFSADRKNPFFAAAKVAFVLK